MIAGVTPTPFDAAAILIKLAAVLERLLVQRVPPAVSIKDLAAVADLPWAEQVAAAFGRPEG